MLFIRYRNLLKKWAVVSRKQVSPCSKWCSVFMFVFLFYGGDYGVRYSVLTMWHLMMFYFHMSEELVFLAHESQIPTHYFIVAPEFIFRLWYNVQCVHIHALLFDLSHISRAAPQNGKHRSFVTGKLCQGWKPTVCDVPVSDVAEILWLISKHTQQKLL